MTTEQLLEILIWWMVSFMGVITGMASFVLAMWSAKQSPATWCWVAAALFTLPAAAEWDIVADREALYDIEENTGGVYDLWYSAYDFGDYALRVKVIDGAGGAWETADVAQALASLGNIDTQTSLIQQQTDTLEALVNGVGVLSNDMRFTLYNIDDSIGDVADRLGAGDVNAELQAIRTLLETQESANAEVIAPAPVDPDFANDPLVLNQDVTAYQPYETPVWDDWESQNKVASSVFQPQPSGFTLSMPTGAKPLWIIPIEASRLNALSGISGVIDYDMHISWDWYQGVFRSSVRIFALAILASYSVFFLFNLTKKY